jgi:hypothetical protein
MKIHDKVKSVVKSCKTESQLINALEWAYRVTPRRDISENLSMIYWKQDTYKSMMAYFARFK